MPKVYGKFYTKEEILRRVGNTSQVFGIKPVEYFAGKANKVKAYNVFTGGGLEFTVLENKCLDIFEMKYNGVNLHFVSKAGLNTPYNIDQHGSEFRMTQGCGMLYTAGLTNVGASCNDDGIEHYFHGRIKNISAENISAVGNWDGDEYPICISGETRESSFFGINLALHREIRTSAGAKNIFIRDTIENEDFKEQEIMLLYHLNTGFPIVDENAVFTCAMKEIEPCNELSVKMKRDFEKLTLPIDNQDEYLYVLRTKTDANGWTASAILNKELGLGLYIKYETTYLDYLVEWKSMKSGDYAFGMLPSNCKPEGRIQAKESGNIKTIRPFEKWIINMEIGVLEGEREMKDFIDYIRELK